MTTNINHQKEKFHNFILFLLLKLNESFLYFQDGFVEFYEGGPERRNESPWPSLKTICGYAAGAIGVLTLGAILAQRS